MTGRSNGTQRARSTMVGPCGPGRGWDYLCVSCSSLIIPWQIWRLQGHGLSLGIRRTPCSKSWQSGPRDIAKYC